MPTAGNVDDTSGDAHTQRCAPGRDQVPHSTSTRGIDSLISDARVTAETQQVQFSNKVASTHRSLSDDRRRWPRQCLEAQQLHLIDKSCERSVGDVETGADHSKVPEDCRDTAGAVRAVMSHEDRVVDMPVAVRDHVPMVQTVQNTVEVSQVHRAASPAGEGTSSTADSRGNRGRACRHTDRSPRSKGTENS